MLLVLACAPVALAQADLRTAARTGDVALLESRLRQGADPNARDKEGRTPLLEAVTAGQVPVMRLLIGKGADVNARAHNGETPLIAAAAEGSLEAARLLVASGADLNVVARGWGSALKAAERTGHNDIAAMLLKAGARPTGSSVGDTVCVRPWGGEGYCGTVELIDKNRYSLRVTKIVGCEKGCAAKTECSAGHNVGGSGGIAVGDEVSTVSWCLTDTGVRP
jgi:ankyrin repeat protein